MTYHSLPVKYNEIRGISFVMPTDGLLVLFIQMFSRSHIQIVLLSYLQIK